MTRMSLLIVALDTRNAARALRLAEDLKGVVSWLKVGLELFSHTGPSVVRKLKRMGFNVFLDLKMFDIPNTVRGGVLSAAAAGADMLTIHTLGGERMARAALAAAESVRGGGPLVLGVTVLTSMEPGELPGRTEDPGALVVDLAMRAGAWGLHGVVCSGHEVGDVKRRCGRGFICLTPGIRPSVEAEDDQRRVVTPAEAVAGGADFLVAGRPVSQAADPVAAARAIIHDMRRRAS